MAIRHYRAHQRFAVRIPVTLSSERRPVLSQGESVDLGVGGAAFEVDTPLRLGESVRVTLHTAATVSAATESTGVPSVFEAEVAWVGWAEASAVRLGVRFRHSNAEQLAALLDSLGVVSLVGT